MKIGYDNIDFNGFLKFNERKVCRRRFLEFLTSSHWYHFENIFKYSHSCLYFKF